MEKFVKAVADYGIALIVERWLELIVVVVVLVIWRWFTLHKVRSRIDALEKKANQPTVIQNFHGDVGQVVHVEEDNSYHVTIDGKGEVISPRPIKTLSATASTGVPTVTANLSSPPPRLSASAGVPKVTANLRDPREDDHR